MPSDSDLARALPSLCPLPGQMAPSQPFLLANSEPVTLTSIHLKQCFKGHTGPFLTHNCSTCKVLVPHTPALTKRYHSYSSSYFTLTLLFIHYLFIQQIPTDFTNLFSSLIPLFPLPTPIPRTPPASVPFPTSSYPLCIAPSRFASFKAGEQNEDKEGGT